MPQGLVAVFQASELFFRMAALVCLSADGLGRRIPVLVTARPFRDVLFFLYWFTGIPFIEQQALRSRGEDYRLYQKTTSMFFSVVAWDLSVYIEDN